MTDGERSWVAGRPLTSGSGLLGRLTPIGGTLSLTSDAVVYRPVWRLGPTVRLPLASVEAVEILPGSAPRLVVRSRGGGRLVLTVVARRSTTILDRDASARDDAVATIAAALTR